MRQLTPVQIETTHTSCVSDLIYSAVKKFLNSHLSIRSILHSTYVDKSSQLYIKLSFQTWFDLFHDTTSDNFMTPPFFSACACAQNE